MTTFLETIAIQLSNRMPRLIRQSAGESYMAVDADQLPLLCDLMDKEEAILIGLFAAEYFDPRGQFTLFYVFEKRLCPDIIILQHTLAANRTISIAKTFPSACWFEREMRDGFGIEFKDAYDTRRLFLHEVYPEGFHPLLKSFPNRPIDTHHVIPPEKEYPFTQIDGEDIYQIPVGPVHAGIIEPGHFRFSVIGEKIFNLEVRMFYKHRGIEKLAEGMTPLECVTVAESISGDESAANAAAFCLAVEKITGTEVPLRARQIRTVLLEMERIYSHLGDIAGMIVDVAFPAASSRFFKLREEILRQNQFLSGSRFLKGIICPGGITRDVSKNTLDALDGYLKPFLSELQKALKMVQASTSSIDRFDTTGIINPSLINPLNITGPAARASGADIDTRQDHPYGLYADLPFKGTRTETNGDVLARFEVKSWEIMDSVGILRDMIPHIQEGDICGTFKPVDGYALSLVEAPRGQNMHWVNLKDGLIDRYKVRTASFCNWQAIGHAVMGNIVPDFPVINKSLNLSYAGTDL